MYVELSEAKEHLILNDSVEADNQLIISYIKVAEEILQKYLNNDFSQYEDESGKIPESLKLAVKFLVANFYENREPLTEKQLYKNCYALDYLISPFKKY